MTKNPQRPLRGSMVHKFMSFNVKDISPCQCCLAGPVGGLNFLMKCKTKNSRTWLKSKSRTEQKRNLGRNLKETVHIDQQMSRAMLHANTCTNANAIANAGLHLLFFCLLSLGLETGMWNLEDGVRTISEKAAEELVLKKKKTPLSQRYCRECRCSSSL